MPEHSPIDDAAKHLQAIAGRALSLYSRPTVAMELVRLTEQPHVDARALKECIEKDPALVGKILRVVNSSLFGLTTRVGDLGQAIGLLGIKPLKLLVLGFSLPDALFAEVAARELRWYWTTTLTRAVSARMFCEQFWKQAGDEPFIAGLLEDLGTLVMLHELGRPYAKFLGGAIDEHCHLSALERTTLGFDHVQLTAALLTRWQLPQKLIDAVTAPREIAWLTQAPSAEGDLPRMLHLADLVTQLLCQRRLHVLPELIKASELYRRVTKAQLTELVLQLQRQVDQLADALALELEGGRDYAQILREAHERLGILSEDLVAELQDSRRDADAYRRLQSETGELTIAMHAFLSPPSRSGASDRRTAATKRGDAQTASDRPAPATRPTNGLFHQSPVLARHLRIAGERCRNARYELSLLLLDARSQESAHGAGAEIAGRALRRALDQACSTFDRSNVELVSLGERRAAAVLSNCERTSAVAAAHLAIRQLDQTSDARAGCATATRITLSIGVATASIVPKNFDPENLIESAEGCLNAARASGMSAVKSIEV
jgi:HD-like signal output (HDOD) protein